ncbi:MAG: hypothetical protein IKG22_04490 [Atopobiaceae bacterium]|nr:hypothetical protein [Atopobiaceae bacterium]
MYWTRMRTVGVFTLAFLLASNLLLPSPAAAQELGASDNARLASEQVDGGNATLEGPSLEGDVLEDANTDDPHAEANAFGDDAANYGSDDAGTDATNVTDAEANEADAAATNETFIEDEEFAQIEESSERDDHLVSVQDDANANGNDQNAKAERLVLSYRVQLQSGGWQSWASDGKTSGVPNGGRRVVAIALRLANASGKRAAGISYQTYVQGAGWQAWKSDGSASGMPKKGLRIEAMRIKLTDSLAQAYDVWYRSYVQGVGWQGWTSNGASSGSTCKDKRIEAIEVKLCEHGSPAPGSTSNPYIDGTHLKLVGRVQNKGRVTGTTRVGIANKGVRLEAFSAKLVCGDYDGGIKYAAYVQDSGWQKARRNGKLAGTTTGASRRMEAVRIALTGNAKKHYDVWYRVYVHDYGWLSWTKNWLVAGTTGLSKRVESIQVQVLPKGSGQPKGTATKYDESYIAFPKYRYASQSMNTSWQRYKSAGKTSGSTSASTSIGRVRMRASVPAGAASCAITYGIRQNDGEWLYGTQGEKLGIANAPVSAMRIRLQGPLAKLLNVYYRVYISGVGWLKWTKNDRITGTEGLAKSIERYQVIISAKVNPAPKNKGFYIKTRYYDKAYVEASSTPQSLAKANAEQRKIVSSALATPSPGGGLCADWVERVYKNAGYGMFWGNADDLYYAYCHKSSLGDLKVGMIVAVSTHPHTYMGSIYGHVGVYVGDGWIMDNVGYIRKMSLSSWLEYYGASVTPKWGWLGNVRLA